MSDSAVMDSAADGERGVVSSVVVPLDRRSHSTAAAATGTVAASGTTHAGTRAPMARRNLCAALCQMDPVDDEDAISHNTRSSA